MKITHAYFINGPAGQTVGKFIKYIAPITKTGPKLVGFMEQAVETGKDKVKKICEVLRKETLEPAKEEAEGILAGAKANALQIIEEAKEKAAKLLDETNNEIEKKQKIFQASLSQGARQSVEWLKQEIDERLFQPKLAELITKSTSSPEIISSLVQAIIKSIQEDGLDTDISVVIPSSIEAREVNELLGKEILSSLKEKSVLIGSMKGGIQVKLHKESITVDLTSQALVELITRYIRKDFHKFFYAD